MLSPSDFFSTLSSPMTAGRLWLVWAGMAFFVSAVFSLLYDRSRANSQRVGYVTYGLFGALVVVLIFIFIPHFG
jgi:hypothetical protein